VIIEDPPSPYRRSQEIRAVIMRSGVHGSPRYSPGFPFVAFCVMSSKFSVLLTPLTVDTGRIISTPLILVSI
jgi:hypothetical protein